MYGETAIALVVLTVETDGNINCPEFPRRVASSSRLGFIPSRLKDCTLSLFYSTVKDLIEVQDGFVCVADLENTHRSSVRPAFSSEIFFW